STADHPFYPPPYQALNQGWYSGTESHGLPDTSYFVGDLLSNNFFTFLIPEGFGSISSATLVAQRGLFNPNTAGVPFTYALFDVSTDATTLNTVGSPNPAIFADLGSGVCYGSVQVTDLLTPNPLTVQLNAAAIAAINAAPRNNWFSIGGSIPPFQAPPP